MIRVLLVDDQPLARAGLRRILEPQEHITIVGECEDGDPRCSTPSTATVRTW